MATYPVAADIVVQAADGDLLALVEVKNRHHLTADIATVLRSNLLAHGVVDRRAPYFLIVSQDVGFLWDQRSQPPDLAAPPKVQFSMVPVIQRYLPSLADGERLGGSQVELAAVQWLSDLARGIENRPKEPDAALAKTDFLKMIKGGRVGMEISV
ncbi:MAG: hypothetical protein M3R02_06135 [Chloroflexota bacterium]|nr:hypothetical protein [Chloroflexota bacterium]